MGRRFVLPALEVLTGLVLLSCASGGPGIYWAQFPPTEANFQHYFDEAGRNLHPVEGIWGPESSSRGQLAVVRTGSYPEYDYVAVRITGRGQRRGEIVAALRPAGLELPVFEYACAEVLRGEPCRAFPCRGRITFVRREFWDDPKECFCGLCASYWIKRYPTR